MQHQPEVVLESEGDPFPEPAQLNDRSAAYTLDRRHRRAEHKRARNPQLVQRLAQDASFERFEVNGDVRQFRHVCTLPRRDTLPEDSRITASEVPNSSAR